MKKLVASVLALSVFTSAAMAGGPVVVVEEPMPVVEEQAGTSVGVLPLLLVGIALCVALCGGSDDDGRRDSTGEGDPAKAGEG
jgi:hypothetical protein